MPIIKKSPYSDTAGKGAKGPTFKLRVYQTSGNFMEREYRSIDKMKQFQRYYKNKGIRTRKI